MRLSIVIGVLNAFDLTAKAIELMVGNMENPKECELVIIDNGSDESFLEYVNANIGIRQLADSLDMFTVVKNETNTGSYALYRQGLEHAKGDLVAFIHSDIFIYQKGWDRSVVAQFDGMENMGLIGFIGSTEIDNFGGRGMGTRSNMQGLKIGDFPQGSKAEVHGKRSEGMVVDGAVVDGCVMIFRKGVLASLEVKDMPPHHFYDRMMCCQVLEAGWKVGILGVQFDHLNGQTANHAQKYHDYAREWCEKNLGISTPQEWVEKNKDWWSNMMNPSRGHTPNGWDHVVYLEGERRFLQEYRDQKHLIPVVKA